MTPEQEKRLEEIRDSFGCARWLNSPSWKMAEDLLAMVDSLKEELRKSDNRHWNAEQELEHRHGESPWACCVDMEAERDSLRTQVEKLRGAITPRTLELAGRLVASGPKASHVSASETHEISEAIFEAFALLGTPSKTEET